MSSLIAHQWVTRAKCTCGYIWTTPGAPNVVCSCGNSEIANDVILSGDAVTDEEEFKQSVANDLAIDISELILMKKE